MANTNFTDIQKRFDLIKEIQNFNLKYLRKAKKRSL